jgi:flavin reductase (DIM6/NTAB) family NADH-FMN oxidoreductase RutF
MRAQCTDRLAAPTAEQRIEPEKRAPAVIDHQQFTQALGLFATGLTIATTAMADNWHGVTANAVMSVSLTPPMVLLSIQVGSRMHGELSASDNFALNILGAEQQQLALYFADSTVTHSRDAFEAIQHHLGVTGAPLIDGALSCVDCRIVERIPAGDHVLYLGSVEHVEVGAATEPLLYYHGRFR